jgi:hypothetical protein
VFSNNDMAGPPIYDAIGSVVGATWSLRKELDRKALALMRFSLSQPVVGSPSQGNLGANLIERTELLSKGLSAQSYPQRNSSRPPMKKW